MDGRDNRRSTPTERAQTQVVTTRVLSRKEGQYDGKAAVVPYPGNRSSDTPQRRHRQVTLSHPASPAPVRAGFGCSVSRLPHCSIDAPACGARGARKSRESRCVYKRCASSVEGNSLGINRIPTVRGKPRNNRNLSGKVVEIKIINQIMKQLSFFV